ncbi:uncharacterized protein B0I36DRAFT_334151 [Microdochium trichocladiopsis]|uniref:SET domain-containing protein n=1 Tax=Microdochium trichocladiopsis TaxID=1682393 RepID=A0A9P9BL33_9PEZI|nr:uncharacterized protein B0I36DRAFT_334151 [Microdochium trichocladiopsis]KAH7021267.1 hypothetical protein B0I36DRAFT_334151 [Microdochium trichocladiopsis]
MIPISSVRSPTISATSLPMATSASERYNALVAWVEAAGGSLHPAVEIYIDEDTEGSLRVKQGQSISPGDSIVKLPLVRSLSFLNAISGHPDFPAAASLGVAAPNSNGAISEGESLAGATFFPTRFLRETPPHVIGRFFLIQQHLLGAASPWAPYIQTLPQPESNTGGLLPCAWPAEDVECLCGTNAYVAVQEINATLENEYTAAIQLLSSAISDSNNGVKATEYTAELYKWAYCIFASRSFRQSLTIPAATALSLTAKPDDFSVLLPLFDMGNHHPQAKTAWKTPEESNSSEAGKPAFCELQTGQPYSSGQQVFNNYGASKTNAELLLGYGFVLAESDEFHNDYVHIKTRPGATQHLSPEQQLASTHLVSLQPISDPSSLAVRARSLTNPNPDRIMSCYTHVQDSLVASLYEAVCQAKGLSSAVGSSGGGVTLAKILAGDIPDELTDEIINALGTKLSIDLEKIEAAEAEQGGEAAPRNGNQELALLYRRQCKRVLENALASLSGEEYEAESEEEE